MPIAREAHTARGHTPTAANEDPPEYLRAGCGGSGELGMVLTPHGVLALRFAGDGVALQPASAQLSAAFARG